MGDHVFGELFGVFFCVFGGFLLYCDSTIVDVCFFELLYYFVVQKCLMF